MVIEQYNVYWICLDPTQGREIQKTRPCVVISPDVMNHTLSTIIIAPVTSKFRDIPTRVEVSIAKKQGFVALDQIRTVDKSRITGNKPLARLTSGQIDDLKNVILTMLVQ